MTRRRLTRDEVALWRKVAETTEKLHPDRPVPMPRPQPAKAPPAPQRPVAPFEIGERRTETRGLTAPERPWTAPAPADPVRMDRKSFDKLKRGKLTPEARIDLHGLTLDQAHPRLIAFIAREHRKGRRLVLVITGKGRARDAGGPIPTRPGVLRRSLPHWLSTPPLAQYVLQASEAHLRHGGGGAFYVYLRRHR